MGEYYDWVNVDKKEYICPADFNYGNKYWETMHKDSVPLHALHTLLAGTWKGDRVDWFGDEKFVAEDDPNDVIRELYVQSADFGYPGDAFGMICGSYRDVACLFKEAETEVRTEIGYDLEEYRETGKVSRFNYYGIDYDDPFKGLFVLKAKRYEYVINHTRKVYYSLNETVIVSNSHAKLDFIDPLPYLMGFGKVADPGEWLGDVIGVSDERPEGYEALKEIVVEALD